MLLLPSFIIFFFFNDTATTEIYTLSLHDALPISDPGTVATAHARHGQQLNQLWASLLAEPAPAARAKSVRFRRHRRTLAGKKNRHTLRSSVCGGVLDGLASIESSSERRDRKSTRLNSSHL